MTAALFFGTESFDNFLKHALPGEFKSGMVVAWVATKGSEPEVLGFYTLGALSISVEIGLKEWQRSSVPEIPVIFIRALGVHEEIPDERKSPARHSGHRVDIFPIQQGHSHSEAWLPENDS